MMAGVLVLDKPAGLTSHDVVAAARRALGERRIGHCGTLDPMATGVLVLAVGPATRLVQFLSADIKRYDAVVRFGVETSTYDMTAEVVAESNQRPDRSAVEAALEAFRGPLSQVPPAFSAKKVSGVRAYALARRHADAAPSLPAVAVTCHELALTGFDGERAWLSMAVSAGFYVRSLAHDLGRALGCGAALEALRRTSAGPFELASALPFDRLVLDGAAARAHLVALDALLPDLPLVTLSEEDLRRVRHGMEVALPGSLPAAPPRARLVDEQGRLVAVAVPADRPGFLHPSVVLG